MFNIGWTKKNTLNKLKENDINNAKGKNLLECINYYYFEKDYKKKDYKLENRAIKIIKSFVTSVYYAFGIARNKGMACMNI